VKDHERRSMCPVSLPSAFDRPICSTQHLPGRHRWCGASICGPYHIRMSILDNPAPTATHALDQAGVASITDPRRWPKHTLRGEAACA
jgi:hypothetical protein